MHNIFGYITNILGKLNKVSLKVLVIADRSPFIPIKNILKDNSDIELIITLGDLEYFDIKYLSEVKDIPKIGIYGNHCDGTYLEQLGIINLHLKTFEIKGIKFGGFEGSIKYKKSDYLKMYTQEQATKLFQDFERVDILITHNSPFGIHDEKDSSHIGFKVFNDYIEKNKIKYLLHGHTDPKDKETLYGKTKIIFIYGSEILKLDF